MKDLKRKQYYKHEILQAVLFVAVVYILSLFIGRTESEQIYSNVLIIFAIGQVVTLIIDYLFFW